MVLLALLIVVAGLAWDIATGTLPYRPRPPAPIAIEATPVPSPPAPTAVVPTLPVITATPTITPTPAPTPTPQPTPPAGAAVVLGADNSDTYRPAPEALVHPHGLVVMGGVAYALDAGEIVAVPLAPGGTAARHAPPDGRVGAFLVGELIGLSPAPDGESLLLLDKRGDIYRYHPASGAWDVARAMDQHRSSPNPVYAGIAIYDGRTYILDSSYSQVWRHPFGPVSEGYLPGGDAPWQRVGTGLDLTRGIGLGVDGDVYVLLREGVSGPAALARYTGSPPYRDGAFAAGLAVEAPVYLWVDPAAAQPIYLVDQDGARVRALQPGTGEVLYTYTLADGGRRVRAVHAAGGKLYLSAADALIVYPGSGQAHDVGGGQGPPADGRPDNPARLALMSRLSNPIPGTRFLPERDSLLPGSTRIYRFGIHRGLDMYGGTMGIDIPFGSAARAAGDGVVIRADHHFREMTRAESDAAIRTCNELHYTPPDILDRLRGRQVWIDHGDGLVTRYVHLSGIPPEVTVGASVSASQVVGYVGNSGTSDGVAGSVQGPHLHFEVIIGDDYVGKWLTVPEVRRVLQQYLYP